MLKFDHLPGKGDFVGEAFSVQRSFDNAKNTFNFTTFNGSAHFNQTAENFLVYWTFEGNIGTISYVPEKSVEIAKKIRFLSHSDGFGAFIDDDERRIREFNSEWATADFLYEKAWNNSLGMMVYVILVKSMPIGMVDEVPFFISDRSTIRDASTKLMIPHQGRGFSLIERASHSDPVSTMTAIRDQHEKEMQGKYPGDPLDLKTGKFTPREIVYDYDGFIIASGVWKENGNNESALACRWHPKDGIGYPNGFGRAQWFLLPASAEDVTRSTNPIIPAELTLRFRGQYKKPTIGQWVTTKDGTSHLVNYVYGEADEMVSACGLGKSDSYPIVIKNIVDVESCQSILSKWHSGKECIWLSQSGLWWHSYLYTEGDQINENNNVYLLRRLEIVHPIDAPPTWAYGEWRQLAYCYQLDQMILTDEVEPGTDILKLMSEQDHADHFFTMEDLVSCEFEPPVPEDGWGIRTTADTFFEHERFYRIKGN